MGIDRIGKGAPPPTPDATGVEKKGAVEKTFSVERAEGTKAATEAQAIEGTSALARLRAGEIDVNGYVDLKVEEATRSLHGISPAELDAIKSMLRDQLATDPALSDLVRSAAGNTPSIPED